MVNRSNKNSTTRYVSSTCEVICEENGRKIVAELLDFTEHKRLSVSVDRTVRLDLHWNGHLYIGMSGNLSFISNGPDVTFVKNGRR
jgi:hypothetical protein